MIAFSTIICMALAMLLGIIFTPGEAYETQVNHSPWWAYETDNSIENSYQYYYPYQRQQQQRKVNSHWNYPTRNQAKQKKVVNNRWKYTSFNKDRKKDNFNWNNFKNFNQNKMSTLTPMRKLEMTTREWPAYHLLPPIRMIALPMDEPPQP